MIPFSQVLCEGKHEQKKTSKKSDKTTRDLLMFCFLIFLKMFLPKNARILPIKQTCT